MTRWDFKIGGWWQIYVRNAFVSVRFSFSVVWSITEIFLKVKQFKQTSDSKCVHRNLSDKACFRHDFDWLWEAKHLKVQRTKFWSASVFDSYCPSARSNRALSRANLKRLRWKGFFKLIHLQMSYTVQFSEKFIKAKTTFNAKKLAPAFNEQYL